MMLLIIIILLLKKNNNNNNNNNNKLYTGPRIRLAAKGKSRSKYTPGYYITTSKVHASKEEFEKQIALDEQFDSNYASFTINNFARPFYVSWTALVVEPAGRWSLRASVYTAWAFTLVQPANIHKPRLAMNALKPSFVMIVSHTAFA